MFKLANNELVRAGLFFEYKGHMEDTWSFFAKCFDDKYRQAAVDFTRRNGLNTIVMLLENDDPEKRVTFFQEGKYGTPNLDWQRVNMAMPWFQTLKAQGTLTVPVLFCGGTGKTIFSSYEKHEYYFQQVSAALDNYAAGYLLACESNKDLNSSQHATLLTLLRKYTTKPIGSHIQWNPNKLQLPVVMDVLAYEFSWNPWDGEDHSVEETVNEANNRSVKANRPCWWLECDINVLSNLSRAKMRALTEVQNTIGIGGPT